VTLREKYRGIRGWKAKLAVMASMGVVRLGGEGATGLGDGGQ